MTKSKKIAAVGYVNGSYKEILKLYGHLYFDKHKDRWDHFETCKKVKITIEEC